MDTKNPLYEKDYPEWKKRVWGAVRAFFGGFIATLGVMLISVSIDDLQNWDRIKDFVIPVAIAALTAGIVGLGKYLRDMYPDSPILARLPI
jgi:hypothetical protein